MNLKSLTRCISFCKYSVLKRQFHQELSAIKPGKLFLQSSIEVKVTPATFTLDQARCKVQVALSSPETELSALEDLNSHLQVSVKECDGHNEMVIDVPQRFSDLEPPLCVNVAIPYHYSLQINSNGNNCVQLSKLECESAKITLEDGNCELVNMKALTTEIHGRDVNLVFSKTFTGNLRASLSNGSVLADKLQGQELSIEVVSGNMHINSLYATDCSLHSSHGNIDVGNCHGSTSIQTSEGDIKIGSLDGSLTAHTTVGDMDIHLSSYDNVELCATQGHIQVTVPDTMASRIKMETGYLDADDNLILDIKSRDATSTKIEGTIGEAEDNYQLSLRSLNMKASSIKLGIMDWITAQQLHFKTVLTDSKS